MGHTTLWERNVAALQARPRGLDLLPPLPEAAPVLQQVKLVAGAEPGLKVIGEDGRELTLHSLKGARAEARELVRTAALRPVPCLVALGLGLGYHLLELLPHLKEEQHLVVVEKEPEIFFAALAAMDLGPLWRRPRTVLVVSSEIPRVLSHLKACLGSRNGRHWDFFGHPASLRCHHRYYREVITGLRPLRRESRPPGPGFRLQKEKLRVLVVNPDYFLLPEVMRAFRELGHEIHLSLFDKRHTPGEEVLKKIIQDLRDVSPDLVFTVNHLGFDREGVLSHTLDRLRIPALSWYVDSPAIILSLYEGPKSELAFIFVWDPTYIPEVKALGFAQVYPLPLATDPEVFSPAGSPEAQKLGVSFVGNSMVGPLQKKLERLPQGEEFALLFRQLSEARSRQPYQRLEALLEAANLKGHPLIQALDAAGRTDLEAALVWKATLEYRLRCVRQLLPFSPAIFGDPGWRELLGRGARLYPEVNYYEDLPRIYRCSAINFNATSLQMKAAVNQRVFDVPAAGGFLLTDFRPQLAELFEVGQEVICYHRPEEIPELLRFYLRNPRSRQRIVARARRRVLAEHTYRHRVATMLEIVRSNL